MKIDELKNRLVVVLQGYFLTKYIFKRKRQKGVFISWLSLTQIYQINSLKHYNLALDAVDMLNRIANRVEELE